MSTVVIELKEEQVDRLRSKANRLGLSLESYASKLLAQASETDREQSGEVERHLQASMRENDEAYRRLAQ